MKLRTFLSLWVLGVLVPGTGFAAPKKIVTEDDVIPVAAQVKGKTYPMVAEIAKGEYAQVWIVPGGRPYVEIKKDETKFVVNKKTGASLPLFYQIEKGKVVPMPAGYDDEESANKATVTLASRVKDKDADTVLLKGGDKPLTQLVCFGRRAAARQAAAQGGYSSGGCGGSAPAPGGYYSGVYYSSPTAVSWGTTYTTYAPAPTTVVYSAPVTYAAAPCTSYSTTTTYSVPTYVAPTTYVAPPTTYVAPTAAPTAVPVNPTTPTVTYTAPPATVAAPVVTYSAPVVATTTTYYYSGPVYVVGCP